MTDYMRLMDALARQDTTGSWKRFQVHYRPAERGSYRIENFSINRMDRYRIETILREGLPRDPGWGPDFTRLVEAYTDEDGKRRSRVWMSDSRAEIEEHFPLFNALYRCPPTGRDGRGIRVLINGLGLGVAVHGALMYEGVTRVDVVERDPDIIALVEPLLGDIRVVIHQGDAYDVTWPKGTRWDVAWHDIWPDINDENIPQMDQLRDKYRGQVAWQDSWQRRGCEKMADVFARAKAGTLSANEALDALEGRLHL